MYRTGRVRRASALGAVIAALVWAGTATGQQTPTRPGGRGPTLKTEKPAVQGAPSAPRPSGRPSSGAAVEVYTGTSAGPVSRVSGPAEGAFEPVLMREVTYGPVPTTSEQAQITLTGQMSTSDFLDALSVATGWNIASTEAVRQITLEFWTNEVSPKQALAILEFNKIYYEYDKDANFLFVMTQDEYLERQYGTITQAEFEIKYADLPSVEVVLNSLLSAQGRLISDPTTSKIIVYDTQDNIDYMRNVLKNLDAPRDTRAYQLVNADADSLSSSVEAMLTEGGKLNVDPRSNTLVVTDRPERLERIGDVITLLDQELETRTWTLNYADPEAVADYVADLVPEAMGSIVVNEAVHQITVTATPYRLKQIDARITAWDEKRRQVQIEAYLATASRNIMRNLEINWSYASTVDGNPFSVAVGTLTSTGGDGGDGSSDGTTNLSGTTVNYMGGNLDAIINALDTSNDATILAHPRITVQDGEEAVFENTTRVPFASSTTTFNNNTAFVNTNTQIDFIDVGTILRVTPRITTGENITLAIDAEDSTFVEVEIFANGQLNTLPQKTQNRAQTQVLVRHEETIVLGGLRTSNFRDNVDRVPVLGDIPLLGRVFRTTKKDHQDRELLIFLTPTIIGTSTAPETERLARLESGMAETMRNDARTALGRIAHKLNGGENEFTVTIGQTGGLLAEGELVQMADLKAMIADLKDADDKTLIIREHPRAPKEVASEITEAAMERGMRVEFDTRRFPFVPRVSSQASVSVDRVER